MSESCELLNYSGPVDHKIIDQLLKKLKNNREYRCLNKTTGKRTYSVVVECLENIAKHSVKSIIVDSRSQPFLSVVIQNNTVLIKSGNPVFKVKSAQLTKKLQHVNQLNEGELILLYEKIINKEILKVDNGAGLGFIIMKLKSGNKIEYSFTEIDDTLSYFYFQVSINKFTMRKLIIEQTSSSPKVILDPDKNIFEISGESRPPDVAAFYNEILTWFDDYSGHLGNQKDCLKPMSVDFNFEYFNSSSAKYLLDFCKQISAARNKGLDINVKWHYDKEDTDMLEAGKEMSRIAKFPFDYKQNETD